MEYTDMETYYWATEHYHPDNSFTMQEYLDEVNMLDIVFLDGTYAEGVNAKGEKYALHNFHQTGTTCFSW